LQKQAQIEHLKQLKAIELEKTGLAMRQAQEAEKARLEGELEKKQKEIQNSRNARNRGTAALNKEKRLQEEKK